MSTKIQTLKGFRDFYPKDFAFQNWFYKNAQSVSKLYGFQQYDGPMLEPLDLYAAKSGDELVKKQAFTFQDKGNRTVALRPEMTPTLAKMVANKSGELTFPIKWFTVGSRFRYESPQKGRGREFTQWDVDIIGSDSYLADAEIIGIAAYFYKLVGLSPSQVKIKINDRNFVSQNLLKAGLSQSKLKPIISAIDKKDKLTPSEFNKMLSEEGASSKSIKNIEGFLEDKSQIKNSEWLSKIVSVLQSQGLDEYIEYDPAIVRGLDYYTSTVFEGWDVSGELRALWGGGRYDNLTTDVGSKKKVPAVGFAMGNMVLEELLKKLGQMPEIKKSETKVLVTVFSEKTLDASFNTVKLLKKSNINCELYLTPTDKMAKQLKYADKKGIRYAVIVGPDEILKNAVTVKDLKNKKQDTVPQTGLISKISN